MKLRNVAIIAHVDHGKTTLVDGLLKQSHTFRENEAEMSQTLILDSIDQERERGITILAKNTAIQWGGYTINIIDTPGHADFGGEVERTLNLADGCLLVIDAQEGPMPQTKFVLKKALEIGLKPIVVINKIDKPAARIDEVIRETSDLFLDLATHDHQLEFPVYYAIGREGKAWTELPADLSAEAVAKADLTPLFDAIIEHVPAPVVKSDGPFQLLVTTLDWDSFKGKYAIGRIRRGRPKPGLAVAVLNHDGTSRTGRIDKLYVNQGLKRVEVAEAEPGDIVALTGLPTVSIGDTVADSTAPEALPTIAVEEPTLTMAIGANTSPFAGQEGQFVTSRQILERIRRELETNVSMRMTIAPTSEFLLSGRGELHLSVFIETLRREGYELQVGKPHVILKEIDGVKHEPLEELTIDLPRRQAGVAAEYANAVTAEIIRRRGMLHSQQPQADGSVRLTFHLTTRGLLGLRNQLLTISRGTAVLNSLFLRFEPVGRSIPQLRNGALVASDAGTAVAYGLNIAQGRGTTFIPPQAAVYAGMIVGLNSRESDLDINVTKEKKQTNIRSAGNDDAIVLTPYTNLSLEQCLDFLEEDELLEVTPKSLRLRKRILDANQRAKARR